MPDNEKDPIKEILDTLDPEKDKNEPEKEVVKEPVKEPSKETVPDSVDALAKERGWTKAQAAEHVAVERTNQALKEVETKHPDMPKYKDIMDKELSTYAPEFRRNPALIEKVYYMSKGIALEKATSSASKDRGDQGGGRRIAEPFPGRGEGNGGGDSSKESKLSDEERRVAKFLHVDENSYEQSKGKKNLRDAVERKKEQGGNSADLALNGLTRRR